jgi:hypothetical protein
MEEAMGKPYASMSEDEQKDLDHNIAKFISGETVKVNGKSVTIFDKAFNYWTTPNKGQGDMKVGEEDEDYFRQGMYGNPAETTTTADATVVQQIFRLTGSGAFTTESRAKFATASMVRQQMDLRKAGRQAEADNFTRIVRKKFSPWVKQWAADSRSAPATQVKLDIGMPSELNEVQDRELLLSLVERGFIELKDIAAGVNKEANNLGRFLLCQTILWSKDPAQKRQAKEIADQLGKNDEAIKKAIETTIRQLQSGDVAAPEPSGEQGPPM